jgi:hypothetical protein
LVKALLAGGAPIDALDAKGLSPLNIAARRGNLAIVGRLADAGADLNLPDGAGRTPFASARNSSVREFLAARGAQ